MSTLRRSCSFNFVSPIRRFQLVIDQAEPTKQSSASVLLSARTFGRVCCEPALKDCSDAAQLRYIAEVFGNLCDRFSVERLSLDDVSALIRR